MRFTNHLVACQPRGLAEPDPGFDPALGIRGPVLLLDAPDPLASDLPIGTVRENRRILMGMLFW